MNILALRGSPRKGGNSDVLLAAINRGAEKAGATVDVIRLCDLKINPCLNCGGCDKTGVCIIKDDMTSLYKKIIAAERIIMASPIYFYGITAQAKTFVDRTQALWNRKRLLRQKGEWREDPARKGFLATVAATKGARVFEGAILTMKYGYDAMDMNYAGEFLVRGVDKQGEMAKHEQELLAAEEFGKNIVTGP